MKTHLFRFTGIFTAALLLSLSGSASAAPDKKKKAPASPTDQLDAARAATKKLPSLAADATFKREKFELHLKVRRVGDDWEMTMAGKQPLNMIRKDGSYYISDDEGKTWRPTAGDDELVTAVMAPLDSGQVVGSPRRVTYESLGKEKVDGTELLHLRVAPDAGDKGDPNDLPQEWLAADGKTGWLVRRSHSPAILFKQMVNADITYEALPKDAKIEAPVASVPAKP
jgi:hypothetical protein